MTHGLHKKVKVSIMTHVTPTMTNEQFTEGKRYPVRPHESSKNLVYVTDNKGIERVVTVPVGGQCPHLRPTTGELQRHYPQNDYLTARLRDQVMGYWIDASDGV